MSGIPGITSRSVKRLEALEGNTSVPRTTAGTPAQVGVSGPLPVHAHTGTGEGGIIDSNPITYTPSDATDWNGSADPGNVDDALDQLADRTKTLEGGAGHAALTIGADGEHSLAAQVLSGVDASNTQKGHVAFDATNPAALGVAAPGTAATASHRDHVHLDPVTAHAAAADPHTGYVLESLLDAKGDLITASADNTPAKLTVGADDTILMADSAAGGGLKWVASATPSTQAFGDAAAVGTADTFTRGDHKHAMPANPVSSNGAIRTITFIIDGGGSAITTGIKGDLEIPFACTINRVTLLADQSGSIVIDIWKDTYANYPPTVADTITASAKPTISTATKSQDATLTGWTTSIAAGDTLRFNVDSITTCTRVTLSLKVTET